MPLVRKERGNLKFPTPTFLTLGNFKSGVITLIDQSRLPKDALKIADNIFLYEDGQPGPRPGVDWFGSASPNTAAIDGFDYFDFNGVIHLVMVAGGTVYRSTNDGATWSSCSGATLTAGNEVTMCQNGTLAKPYLYLTNGVDSIVRYDGTTTLQTYSALTTPSAATSAKTGLAGTTYTYYYKISAVNSVGFSLASAKVSQTVDRTRDAWDATSNYVTLTLPAYQGGQTRYDIYVADIDDDTKYYYLDSIASPGTTYKDDGTAIPIPSTTAPIANTTLGPLVEELVNVGSRMYGIRDHTDRYRISFTGSGNFAGAFSNAYDGGYLDWQPGGKFIPMSVQDYDGKGTSLSQGTPIATVWCNSADGQGCILQMTLSTLTVGGSISITVPAAYRLPGSRGTPAPKSVVNVLNDYIFYNSQAFYNFGPRAQFLNLLSTDEASGNIRPTVRTISSSGELNVASVYFEARVYMSVGYGSSTNNATAVYDTERKCWLPKAFSLGFKKFLRYTDTSKNRRLLALKPGDNKLSEISSSFQGDYGVAFNTSLVTGLYPVSKDRFEFQWTEEGEVEFSNPQGEIALQLIGIDRVNGFGTIVSKLLAPPATSSSEGWDTFNWDLKNWDDTTVVPTVFSESSLKRYFLVQRELNAVQWSVTTSSLATKYVLRTLQTWGTDTQAGHPPQWRLT